MRDKEQLVRRVDDVGNKGAEWWDLRRAVRHERRRRPSVENGLDGNIVAGEDMGAFVVIDPREWAYFVDQFGNGRPVEVVEVPFCQEVGWQLKWLRGCEPIYPSFLEWRGTNWLVQLAVAVVSAIECNGMCNKH